MDFSFTEEQIMLRDSVKRLLSDSYNFDHYRKAIANTEGHSPESWAQFAEMQYPGLPIADAHGGLGYGPVELLLLMEEFGRGLCIEPYLANVILSARLIERLGNQQQSESLLPGLLGGQTQVSLGYAEAAGRYALSHCETRATADGDGFLLNGQKCTVLNAPNADTLLILARTDGAPRDQQGLSLFIVSADAEGLTLKPHQVYGGGVAAHVLLNDVHVTAENVLGSVGQAYETLEAVIDLATVATCAEAYGAMQALMEKTLEYSKQRKQFGAPLASFQVLQHRMVDMYVEVQQAQSMVLMAMLKFSEEDRAEQRRAASACKAYIAKASRFVAQQAVQLHGGIGMTEELDIGHYFRRIGQLQTLFGDRKHHLRRFAALDRSTGDSEAKPIASAA